MHLLDRREEQVVVGEAEVRREEAVEALDALVEALHEDVELVGLGRGAGLVDLDPLGAEVDQRLEIGADHVPGEVVREPSAGGQLLTPAVAGADPACLRTVVLVVRPDRECVGTGDRDLQVVVRDRLEEGELVVVVGLAQRRLGDNRGLRVVLVVEAADGAPRRKAVRVVDRPRVHLAPLLLAVEDDLEACTLEQAEGVPARPAAELVFVGAAALKLLDELLMAVHAHLLAPAPRMLDVALLERPAGVRLHEPRRLRERSDLVGQELHAAAPTVAVLAAPSC